jgi:asparagine synthase (glutamine-hydrolysing)
MLARMAHYPWLEPVLGHTGDSGVGLGVVAHKGRPRRVAAATPDRQLVAALDGEFFDGGQGDASRFLSGWHAEGRSFLERLNGEFSAVVWDARRRELHVITDRLGLRCLYVAHSADWFVAASEIKSLLAIPDVDTAWSENGIAQFFAFGHFYAADTFYRGVRAVPPATCGTFRLDDASYSETRYWHPQAGRVTGSISDRVDALEARLAAAVSRRANPGERLGLSLSGGLDARTILGLSPSGADLRTVSIGVDGSLDHRSASELAALAGVPHHQFVLNAGVLGAFEQQLREMVRLTDGHYLDQGIVMPAMRVYRDLGIHYLLRGHGGELLHMRKAYAFSLDDEALAATDAGLEAWLFSHLTDYMLGNVPDDLFTIDLRALARESLQRALARCQAADRPVDRVWELFLNERIHRETALSMHKFGCFATVRQPFLDPDVVDALFSLPADSKLGDELQTEVLRRRRPEFLRVTNANTGARLGAGTFETALARLRLKAGAKLGLKGYQPYERLGLWLRRELRPLVESVVQSEAVVESGLVRPDAVRRVVRGHMSGQANHTFLLMSLLIFALGQETRAASLTSV